MAAGRISAPGSKLGPCVDECAHIDCGQTRTDAAAPCRWCHGPIGYMPGNGIAKWDGRSGEFYRVQDQYAHAVCEEEAAEEERSGGHPEPAERRNSEEAS